MKKLKHLIVDSDYLLGRVTQDHFLIATIKTDLPGMQRIVATAVHYGAKQPLLFNDGTKVVYLTEPMPMRSPILQAALEEGQMIVEAVNAMHDFLRRDGEPRPIQGPNPDDRDPFSAITDQMIEALDPIIAKFKAVGWSEQQAGEAIGFVGVQSVIKGGGKNAAQTFVRSLTEWVGDDPSSPTPTDLNHVPDGQHRILPFKRQQ